MPRLLWDASALAKRYVRETGSEVVQALFDGVPRSKQGTTIWGYAETFSILLRRYKGGVIRRKSLLKAISSLRGEIIESADFSVLSIDDDAVLDGIDLMQAHTMNTSDAAILATFLRYSRSEGIPPCILVTADKHLVRAAPPEGLPVVNPETFALEDVSALLTSTIDS